MFWYILLGDLWYWLIYTNKTIAKKCKIFPIYSEMIISSVIDLKHKLYISIISYKNNSLINPPINPHETITPNPTKTRPKTQTKMDKPTPRSYTSHSICSSRLIIKNECFRIISWLKMANKKINPSYSQRFRSNKKTPTRRQSLLILIIRPIIPIIRLNIPQPSRQNLTNNLHRHLPLQTNKINPIIIQKIYKIFLLRCEN